MNGFLEDSHKGGAGASATPARPLNADETARAVALLALMGKRDYVDGRLPDSGGLVAEQVPPEVPQPSSA